MPTGYAAKFLDLRALCKRLSMNGADFTDTARRIERFPSIFNPASVVRMSLSRSFYSNASKILHARALSVEALA